MAAQAPTKPKRNATTKQHPAQRNATQGADTAGRPPPPADGRFSSSTRGRACVFLRPRAKPKRTPPTKPRPHTPPTSQHDGPDNTTRQTRRRHKQKKDPPAKRNATKATASPRFFYHARPRPHPSRNATHPRPGFRAGRGPTPGVGFAACEPGGWSPSQIDLHPAR